MKRDVISDAIDKIDAEFIAEADNYRVDDRDNRILYRIAAVCASVLIVAAGVPLLIKSGLLSGFLPGSKPKGGTMIALNVTEKSYDEYLDKFAECEYEPWSDDNMREHNDPDAAQECTVEFMGETYTGEYMYTSVARYNSYPSLTYSFDGGGFSVRADTGELDSITFVPPIGGNGTLNAPYDRPSGEAETVGDYGYHIYQTNDGSYNILKRRADEIAGEYIDVSKYTSSIKIDGPVHYNTIFGCIDGVFNTVTFTSHIGGVRAGDSVSVTIMNDESLYSFSMDSRGAFDKVDKDVIARLADSDEATGAAESKLSLIFGGDLDSFELSDKLIVALEDGNFGVVYTYYVKLTARSEGSSGGAYEHTAELLLMLGEAPDEESETNKTDDNDEDSDLYGFDPDRRVPRADTEKLREGMTYSEVVELLGKPQGLADIWFYFVRYICDDDIGGVDVYYNIDNESVTVNHIVPWSYAVDSDDAPYELLPEAQGITVYLDDDRHRDGVTTEDDAVFCVVSNLTGSDVEAENPYKLQHKVDGEYKNVLLQGSVDDLQYTYSADHTSSESIFIKEYYGVLRAGEYRLLFDIDDGGKKMVTCEFTVTEAEKHDISDMHKLVKVNADNSITREVAEKVAEGMTVTDVVGAIGRPNSIRLEGGVCVVMYAIRDFTEHHLTLIYKMYRDGGIAVVSAYIESEYLITDTDPGNVISLDEAAHVADMSGQFSLSFDVVVDEIGKPNRVSEEKGYYVAEYDCRDGGVVRIRYCLALVNHIYLGCMDIYELVEVILPGNGSDSNEAYTADPDNAIDNADIAKIAEGMTIYEVIDAIGKPNEIERQDDKHMNVKYRIRDREGEYLLLAYYGNPYDEHSRVTVFSAMICIGGDAVDGGDMQYITAQAVSQIEIGTTTMDEVDELTGCKNTRLRVTAFGVITVSYFIVDENGMSTGTQLILDFSLDRIVTDIVGIVE